jgi:protein Mpv17
MLHPLTAGKPILTRRVLQRPPRLTFRRPQSTHQNEATGSSASSKTSTTTGGSNETGGTSARTIPGPIWLWTQPLNSYSRMHKARPYTVQVISATIIYFIGDLVAQRIAPTPPIDATIPSSKDAPRPAYDPARTVRALLIGSLAAIPGYHWFLFLARNFNYSSKAGSIVVKVLVNQIVFTPIFNSYFFGMQSGLSGAAFEEVVERIRHTVPRSWINSWKLWPVVTAFSFAFVRVELRGLFAGKSHASSAPFG